MDRTISEDVGKAVKVGLTVFDSDGAKIGHVDETDKSHGWMVVRIRAFDQKKLWVPYRLVRSVDAREIFLTMLKGAVEAEFNSPPARKITVAEKEGRRVATTTEPSGFDREPLVTSEVDLGHIKNRLAVEQQVWTSDDVAVGRIKDFDRDGRYIVLEVGHVSSKHHLLVPISLVADVDREAAEATLAVSHADLESMKRHEPGESVIELQAPADYTSTEAQSE
jgi:hypothetical protein